MHFSVNTVFALGDLHPPENLVQDSKLLENFHWDWKINWKLRLWSLQPGRAGELRHQGLREGRSSKHDSFEAAPAIIALIYACLHICVIRLVLWWIESHALVAGYDSCRLSCCYGNLQARLCRLITIQGDDRTGTFKDFWMPGTKVRIEAVCEDLKLGAALHELKLLDASVAVCFACLSPAWVHDDGRNASLQQRSGHEARLASDVDDACAAGEIFKAPVGHHPLDKRICLSLLIFTPMPSMR